MMLLKFIINSSMVETKPREAIPQHLCKRDLWNDEIWRDRAATIASPDRNRK